ncbi:MAG: hypothetical protein Q8O05_01970 [Chloroflexota bacterium]|nr:hypothetical protein [Chloroflexota bacterium]
MSKSLRVLAAAVVLSLAVLTVPARSALAAPAITLSPTIGLVNSTVDVSGTGFAASVAANVYFFTGLTSVLVASDVTAADGSIVISFNVPESPGGNHTVQVQTTAGNASAVFVVDQATNLNRTEAHVGDQVTVSGTGWTASDTVNISFDGSTVGSASTNAAGSFSGVNFAVPERARANYLVTLTDGQFTDSVSLPVRQWITLNPISGGVATSVNVRGTGFRASQAITITYDGNTINTNPASIIASSLGSFNVSLTVPAGASRAAQVIVSDGVYTASATFNLVTSFTLNPRTGKVGTTVNTSGSGFDPNRSISIAFDGNTIATVTTDTSGAFSTTFAIPASANGNHAISASDGTFTASTTFQTLPNLIVSPTTGRIRAPVTVSGTGFGVNQQVTVRFGAVLATTTATDTSGSFSGQFAVPQLATGNYNVVVSDGVNTITVVFAITVNVTLSNTTGNVGTVLTITGSGFAGPVNILYDSTAVAAATADATGDFSATFTVPPSLHGPHTITIGDAINKVQATFTMDSTPPPVPQLLLPAAGARQNEQPALSWGAVADPSGVTYTLQISANPDFTNIILQKQGLTVTEYTLTQAEKLPPNDKNAPYYWRVKTTDLAQNESAWSVPGGFYVSFFPPWALYTLYSLGGLIVILFFFWLGRKTASSAPF